MLTALITLPIRLYLALTILLAAAVGLVLFLPTLAVVAALETFRR